MVVSKHLVPLMVKWKNVLCVMRLSKYLQFLEWNDWKKVFYTQ
jgi:hypothetical protein